MKFFLGSIAEKRIFANNLVFQGSNDGGNYTDLFTVDDRV